MQRVPLPDAEGLAPWYNDLGELLRNIDDRAMQPKPVYKTKLGKAFCGDSLDFMRGLPDGEIDLVVTSPPYALHFKKEYGNADQKQYVAWFLPFAREIRRILKPDGSFVLIAAGRGHPGAPSCLFIITASCLHCATTWASTSAKSFSGTIPPRCPPQPNG